MIIESEDSIERYANAQASKLGGVSRKLKYNAIKGAPDRLFLFDGWYVFIELKRHTESKRKGRTIRGLTENQIREGGYLTKAGLKYFVAHSREDIDIIFESKGTTNERKV